MMSGFGYYIQPGPALADGLPKTVNKIVAQLLILILENNKL